MGPRVTGTPENEVQAVSVLTEELRDALYKSNPAQSLLYEVQKSSGAYTLEYVPRFTNIYENIQNVVAMVEGSSGEHGILLNCHFDSVPTSDGASDDAISCAVMLELVRVLTQAPKRLKHNVIFLFNGAEETCLQGSHMFLSHKWASNARVLVNLEAAGLGGRSILFQSGPENSWLFNYYARAAPHPHGLIVGEELFQSGVLPSDTDFRIFRDFFHIPGLDFAFARNGYVYHTIYDSEKYIPAGCHQHMGDNTLALVRALGHAKELEDLKSHAGGKVVYFDYLGWFMVRYPHGAGIAINILVFLLSVVSVVVFMGRLSQWMWLPEGWGPIVKLKGPVQKAVRPVEELWDRRFKSTPKGNDSAYSTVGNTNGHAAMVYRGGDQGLAWMELGYALLARVGGLLAGLLACVIMGAFIDGVSPLAMPWFSNVWLLFPLFWCPFLAVCELPPLFMNKWRKDKRGLSLALTAQLNLVAAQIPWALALFVMTCANYRSAAVLMVPVLFSAVANLVIHLSPLYRSVHTWVWVYLAVHLPSLMFQMYCSLLFYMVLVPIMGRSGTINGDLLIGVVSGLIAAFTVSFAMPLMTLVRRPGLVLALLGAFALLMLPVALPTSVGHPYRGGPSTPAPQRFWIIHSERTFYNESSEVRRHETGYFVLNLDRNSPRTIKLGGRPISYLAQDCDDELYCGVPMYVARMVPLSRTSSWIPAEAPILPSPTGFSVKERACTANPPRCTLNMLIRGPIRITVTFAPREGVTVDSWSLPTEPKASGEWKGRPAYFLHIVRTDTTSDFPLFIQFNVTDVTAPMVDLGLAGNHIHNDNMRTPEFQAFLKEFDDWTQMTGWISSYEGRVF